MYEYLLPTYVLLPPRPGCTLDRKLRAYRAARTLPPPAEHAYWAGYQAAGGDDEAAEGQAAAAPAAAPTGKDASEAADKRRRGELARKRAWRAGADEVERLRAIMKGYLGTQ